MFWVVDSPHIRRIVPLVGTNLLKGVFSVLMRLAILLSALLALEIMFQSQYISVARATIDEVYQNIDCELHLRR